MTVSVNDDFDDAAWSIGILAGKNPFSLCEIKGLTNPVLSAKDVTDIQATFVADPFLIFECGVWHMFFEVLTTENKGVISVARSHNGISWQYQSIVLEEDFHLSYPYVFCWRGKYYMIPETLEVGCIRLYEATRFPFEWRPLEQLVPGQFADSSIFRHDGTWWLLACGRPEQHDQLRLFHSERLLGPWKEHVKSPVVDYNPHFARPAGTVLFWGGKPLRFAQDCYPTYGLRVTAWSICILTTKDYSETVAVNHDIVGPGSGWNELGMHHVGAIWNRMGDQEIIAAVDGLGRSNEDPRAPANPNVKR